MFKFDSYIKEALNFDDMFGDDWEKIKSRKIIKTDPPKAKEIVLDLYRGFDADIEKLERDGDGYILSPEKSEQQSLWFSQWLRDAQGRGEWILKYQLPAIKHYERIYYDDETYTDKVPEFIETKSDPVNDSKIYGGIELPDGWFWSYKTQKYIVCKVPLKINRYMIKKDSEYTEEI